MKEQRHNQRFQSTLPLRGATGVNLNFLLRPAISIHAPLTGSDIQQRDIPLPLPISIHAPLTGSDTY